MNRWLWILLVVLVVRCDAQVSCLPGSASKVATRALSLQTKLRQGPVEDMDTEVPAAIAEQMEQLKDALSQVTDEVLHCAKPEAATSALQMNLVSILHANGPEPPADSAILKNDHRYDEALGAYGHDLRVKVSRPADGNDLIEVQYSINIECGSDIWLLVYQLRNGVWTQRLRWQAPLLKEISDAYGDFFESAILRGPAFSEEEESNWRLVVAHGVPWCTSRFSGFKIDVIAPGSNSAMPRVIWHTERPYSRGDFVPRIKSSANTFELRLNTDNMDMDPENGYERRVIYRYRVESDERVHRLNPFGRDARGFVHEWLSAPWEESRDLSEAAELARLKLVHDGFDPPMKSDSEYVRNSYGPVRSCSIPGLFQVQIDSELETMVPGKPGGNSKPIASYYFHVRESKDGYAMVSASTTSDPNCVGGDLMRKKAKLGR